MRGEQSSISISSKRRFCSRFPGAWTKNHHHCRPFPWAYGHVSMTAIYVPDTYDFDEHMSKILGNRPGILIYVYRLAIYVREKPASVSSGCDFATTLPELFAAICSNRKMERERSDHRRMNSFS